jgi:hypothetical protein
MQNLEKEKKVRARHVSTMQNLKQTYRQAREHNEKSGTRNKHVEMELKDLTAGDALRLRWHGRANHWYNHNTTSPWNALSERSTNERHVIQIN